MKLLVGLGNPGAQYAQNRHNIGFMCLDSIADTHGAAPWRSKFQGAICEIQIDGQKVLLLKPQTFMNKSGASVYEASRFYKIAPSDIWVFHDEIDLDGAKLRLKRSGGHAGHNGLRSIHGAIGEEYARVRIGVGHPGHKDAVARYVLSDFPKADQIWIKPLIEGCAKNIHWLINDDDARFSSEVSRGLTRPEVPKKPKPSASKPAKSSLSPAEHGTDVNKSPLQKLIDKFR